MLQVSQCFIFVSSAAITTFPLYRIAFRGGAKSIYPIRNVQLSEAERNNISPLQ
jgi:hypothetical protein